MRPRSGLVGESFSTAGADKSTKIRKDIYLENELHLQTFEVILQSILIRIAFQATAVNFQT